MKYLLITLILAIATLSYSQGEVYNLNFYKTKVLEIPNKIAQKHFEEKYEVEEKLEEAWHVGFNYDYESEQEVETVVFAFFKREKSFYTVVYNLEGEWLATEKRVTKKGELLDYKEEYPSYNVFPKKIKRFLQKNDYGMNPYNNELEEGALMDAFEIEVPTTHSMVETHGVTIFYAVNWDGVCIAATEEGKIETEKFYRFY